MAGMYTCVSVIVGFILINLARTNGFDCESFVQRTDVTRLEKIYSGCLGKPIIGPKLLVHKICPLMKQPTKLIQLDETSPEYRPIEDNVSYKFQIVKMDWTITGDVINTIPDQTRDECSSKCTDDPTCFSFSYINGGSCILANTCNPAGVAGGGLDTYNMAFWYQA